MEQTLTDTTIIDKMIAFIEQGKNTYYRYIIAFDDGYMHEVPSAPCFGELRPYNEDGDTAPRPSDLRHPWPKTGHPIGMGISLSVHWRTKDKDFENFFWGVKSPWRSAYSDTHIPLHDSKTGQFFGAVFTNTKISPDPLVNGFQVSRSINDGIVSLWKKYQEAGATEEEAFAILASGVREVHASKLLAQEMPYWSYYLREPDVQRLMTGQPKALEKTFFNRGAYRRPIIEHIFEDKNRFKLKNKGDAKSVVSQFKEFITTI